MKANVFFKLTSRPTNLHIVMDEVYPSTRYANQKPRRAPVVVQDMTHMANFVYEFYIQRAKQLKEYYKVNIRQSKLLM